MDGASELVVRSVLRLRDCCVLQWNGCVGKPCPRITKGTQQYRTQPEPPGPWPAQSELRQLPSK
eukprot:6649500-Alexandrium_andersonii.AAC.1